MNDILIVLLVVVGIKTVVGFRFSWEKCSCCGKKQKEHNQEHYSADEIYGKELK